MEKPRSDTNNFLVRLVGGRRVQWKLLRHAAALACAAIAIESRAEAQVTATATGSVTASYSADTDQNGDTTYTFVNASDDISIDLPVIPTVATAAVGNQYWSSPLTWGNTGIVLIDHSALTVGDQIAGVLSGDIFSVLDIPGTAQTLVNSGPTESTLGFPDWSVGGLGVQVSLSVSANLRYDVLIPTGANVLMDQPTVVVQSLIIQQGGSLTGNGAFTVRTDLSNYGALYSLGGTVQGSFFNGSTVQQGGGADITGPLTVQGSFTNAGTISIESGATLSLSQSGSNIGTMILYGGAINGSGTLTNSGTFQKTGAGTATISGGVQFQNTGTVEVDGGTLEMDGVNGAPSGSPNVSSSNGTFIFSNGGVFHVTNAVLAFSGVNAGSGNGVLLVGSNSNVTTIEASNGGSATLNFGSGNFVLSDETYIGPGITNSGYLQIAPTSSPVYLYASLTNTGTIQHTQGAFGLYGSATLYNQGLYQIAGGTSISVTNGGNPILFNSGTFQKTGAGTATISGGVQFQNTGTVEVDGGTLEMDGVNGAPSGSPNVSSSNGTFIFSNGGVFHVTNAVLAFSGVNAGSGNGVLLVGSNSNVTTIEASNGGSATLNFGSGNFVLSDETYIGPGITNSGYLQIAPTSSPVYLYASLTNTGTIQHTQGAFGLYGSATLYNQGLYQIAGGTSISVTNGGNPILFNSGTFQKTGAGTAAISGGVQFQNTGTVEVDGGTLEMDGGFMQTSGVTVLEGGNISGSLTIQGGLLTGSGNINGAGQSGVVTIASGGTIAPGSATAFGTLNTGSQTWAAGGYIWKLTPASSSTIAAQDSVVINGTLNIVTGAGTFGLIVTRLGGGALNNQTFDTGTSFTVADVTGPVVVNGGSALAAGADISSDFTVTDAALANSWDVTLVNDGSGGLYIEVQVTAAPEPSSVALLGLASAGLLRRRQRASNSNSRPSSS